MNLEHCNANVQATLTSRIVLTLTSTLSTNRDRKRRARATAPRLSGTSNTHRPHERNGVHCRSTAGSCTAVHARRNSVGIPSRATVYPYIFTPTKAGQLPDAAATGMCF